jgi:hypothetical protein
MATAWEVLKQNSTLVSGTAWEHLNNQEGGGEGIFYTLVDGLEVEMSECDVDVEIIPTSVEVEIDNNEIEVEIEVNEFTVEVC